MHTRLMASKVIASGTGVAVALPQHHQTQTRLPLQPADFAAQAFHAATGSPDAAQIAVRASRACRSRCPRNLRDVEVDALELLAHHILLPAFIRRSGFVNDHWRVGSRNDAEINFLEVGSCCCKRADSSSLRSANDAVGSENVEPGAAFVSNSSVAAVRMARPDPHLRQLQTSQTAARQLLRL